jgi:uncharacterized protein (TIGR02246 family)
MRIRFGIVVAAVVAALWGGFMAHGQIGDKATTAVQKGADTAKKAAASKSADTGKKSADPAKKPADTSKATGGITVNPVAADDPDEKEIRASAESFTKLYNAHDSKRLAALFSPKAEMIDEDGLTTRGRDAIEGEFAKVFKEHPKAEMKVDVESVRVLSSILAIEEGTAISRESADEPESATEYVAIHVKTDGKWLLACVRDWDAPAAEMTPHDHLQELAWLIGEWVEESPDSVIHSVWKWHDNENFLIEEFQVQIAGRKAMAGTVRVGWDAVSKQFRSWVFDSHGGHGEGYWLRDGDVWIVKSRGSTAVGESASSTNVYRRVDDDTLGWRSYDRLVDGERQDDVDEIVIKRRPPLPVE